MKCWEFMSCPREVYTSCPAYPMRGHECWKMPHTLCDGGRHVKDSLVEKVSFCRQCEYYKQLMRNIAEADYTAPAVVDDSVEVNDQTAKL